MLKKIYVKNFKSIDEIELDFAKTQIDYLNDFVLPKYNIVNPCILFGKNATGKTSILSVFQAIYKYFNIDAINGDSYPFFMHNKYKYNNLDEVVFRLTIQIGKEEYQYELIGKNYDEVVTEKLFNENGKELLGEYNLSNGPKILQLKNSEEKFLKKIYEYFTNFHYVTLEGNITSNINMNIMKIIMENQNAVYEILKDIGEFPRIYFFEDVDDVGRKHLKYFEYPEEYKEKPSEYKDKVILSVNEFMSNGTKKIYQLLSFLMNLRENALVIVDEIENMIHPLTLSKLISNFNKYFDIQLLASSHNTYIMKAIRPDQIYIVKKQKNITSVQRVTDMKKRVRETQNKEKIYYEHLV